MAVGDQLANVTGGLFSGTLALTFWILVSVLVAGAIIGVIYYFFVYRKRFNIKVKVISERAHDPSVFFDKAAVYTDRDTKTKYLRMKDLRVDLEIPSFKIFENTNEGDYVEIHRVSEDEFRFLTNPKIDRKFFIKRNGKVYPFSQMKQRNIESDIDWIISRKEKSKSRLMPSGIISQILQHAPAIVMTAILFMVMWVVLDKFPELLNAATKLAEAIAQSQTPVTLEG